MRVVDSAGWPRWVTSPKCKAIGIGFLVVYLSIHLLTLARAPLPWFDDTFYASVTDSLVSKGELRLPVSPLYFDKPVYIYGPAYFCITSVFAHFFPFDLFAFRLPSLAFSLAVCVLIGAILVRDRVPLPLAAFVSALIAVDPTYYKGMHGGRMDSMVLFLILVSFLSLPRSDKTAGIQPGRTALSGFAAAGALLTTPRPVYLIAAIGLILLWRFIREREVRVFWQVILWGLCLILPYLGWFLYAFGSIAEMTAYYRSLPGGQYVGGFSIHLLHVPLLLTMAILVALRRPAKASGETLFFAVAGIIGFYVVVHDPGLAYACLMVPLAYLIIGHCAVAHSDQNSRVLPAFLLAGLLVFNLAGYAVRNTLIFLYWSESSPMVAEEALTKLIPPGSRVVGDEKYYFSVRRIGSDFQYMDRGGTLEERARYHRDIYHATYVVTGHSEGSMSLTEYIRVLELERIGEITSPTPGPVKRWLLEIADMLKFMPETDYAGTVWKSTRSPQ